MRLLPRLSVALVWIISATSLFAQQGYPSRPIRLVVSWAPGGASDLIARVVGEKLGEQLGQQILIDNRAGASGAIGTQMAAKGVPDGYTLLFGGVTELVLNPQIVKVPYDPMHDFSAVSPAAFGYYVMVVHPALPAKSVRELIGLAKARPGEINYASGGSGSNLALVAELFRTKAGIRVAHVPYKGGGPASVAVMAGESQMMFGAIASTLPYVESNRLNALALTGLKRSPLLPKVPTFEESGLRDMDVGMWFGVLAPAATQKDITARLNTEVVRMAATPAYGAAINKLGFDPLSSSPEKFSAFMKTELDTWGKVIKDAGVKGG